MSGSLLVGPGALSTWVAKIAGEQQRDRVQHQADDELVDVEIDAQERRNGRPGSPAEEAAARIDGGQMQADRQREGITDDAGDQRADQHLAFGADVPQAGAEARSRPPAR